MQRTASTPHDTGQPPKAQSNFLGGRARSSTCWTCGPKCRLTFTPLEQIV